MGKFSSDKEAFGTSTQCLAGRMATPRHSAERRVPNRVGVRLNAFVEILLKGAAQVGRIEAPAELVLCWQAPDLRAVDRVPTSECDRRGRDTRLLPHRTRSESSEKKSGSCGAISLPYGIRKASGNGCESVIGTGEMAEAFAGYAVLARENPPVLPPRRTEVDYERLAAGWHSAHPIPCGLSPLALLDGPRVFVFGKFGKCDSRHGVISSLV